MSDSESTDSDETKQVLTSKRKLDTSANQPKLPISNIHDIFIRRGPTYDKSHILMSARSHGRQDVIDLLEGYTGNVYLVDSMVEYACTRNISVAEYIADAGSQESINIHALARVAENLEAVKWLVKKFNIDVDRILSFKVIETMRAAGHEESASWLETYLEGEIMKTFTRDICIPLRLHCAARR
jgi:hypothetical protein